jgi:hypothetical protein
MTTTTELPVFLTVRGTIKPPNLEAMRTLHNDTAGSERGIAAARSLGDLSHKVFAPCLKAQKLSSAKDGELLFLDVWENPKGIMDFFSSAETQAAGGTLFKSRDATVWMPARDAFSFHLPAAMDKRDHLVGLIRGPVKAPEEAIAVFRTIGTKGLRDARRRGQLSHDLFVKLNPPGDSSPVEIIGLDVWSSLPGLLEHYGDNPNLEALGSVFTAAPQATVWEQPPGNWSEW